jgi:DoxX-like family
VTRRRTRSRPDRRLGLAVEQAGAIAVHVRRKEPQAIIADVVLIAMAFFVAWGRFGD